MTLVPPRRISAPFDEPFYTGGVVVSQAKMWPLPIAIAGHRYLVEWEAFERSTVSPFRDARDQNALPGEQSLNPLGAWKRTRDDWSLGSGQTWADRALEPFNTRIEIEPRQFRLSKGINVWTLGQFQLLQDTEVAIASTNTNLKLQPLGTWLYFVDGASLKRTNNPTAASPTVSTITGLSGTIRDITTDGQRIYVSTSTGLFKTETAGTTATALAGAAATYAPTVLEWANGWLFGCDTNHIREIRADGTVNLVYTHLNADFLFSTITGTPAFAYFGGGSADANEIYRVGTKTDGTLGPGIFSGSVPRGKFIRDLAYYGSFVLIGASNGFHIAAITGDGSLNVSPVILTQTDVRCCWAEGRFVWFGWTNYDSTSTGLGRVDLASFSDLSNLVPAWASDLMYTGQGVIRSNCMFGSKMYFAVDGVGVIRQHNTNKVASGTLGMGRFRWGTYEPKAWIGIEIVSDPLTGATDGIVGATVLDDEGGLASVGQRGPGNTTTGIGQVYGLGIVHGTHDWYEPTIVLTRPADPTATPVIRRVTIRALPTPMLVEQFMLPLVMSRTVLSQTQDGQEVGYDTNEEYTFLQNLLLQAQVVTLQIGVESHLVTVRELGWTKVYGMTPDRQSVEGIIKVTLVTAEF